MSMQKLKRLQVQRVDLMLHDLRLASATPLPLLRQVADALVEGMSAGLEREEGSEQLKMLPSYIEHLPSGNEKGLFYAVDLGGTNFRVLRVCLGGKKGEVLSQEYKEMAIPRELMTGTGKVGKDIVMQFQDAIGRSGHNVEISARVNHTVGTLAGGRYNFQEETMIGCIIGTGTNACYVERADVVKKWKEPLPKSGEMVINIEWGNFRSPWLPRTYADAEVDNESVNPGDQCFEKMVSGMYLGEIVRHMLLKLAEEAALFGNTVPRKLTERHSLETPHVSKMHADTSADLQVVTAILHQVLGDVVEKHNMIDHDCSPILDSYLVVDTSTESFGSVKARPSLVNSTGFFIFSAEDAFSTIDFSKAPIEDGVVDNPDNEETSVSSFLSFKSSMWKGINKASPQRYRRSPLYGPSDIASALEMTNAGENSPCFLELDSEEELQAPCRDEVLRSVKAVLEEASSMGRRAGS